VALLFSFSFHIAFHWRVNTAFLPATYGLRLIDGLSITSIMAISRQTVRRRGGEIKITAEPVQGFCENNRTEIQAHEDSTEGIFQAVDPGRFTP